MPSPPRQPTHEEIQAIERFREKVDKLSMHKYRFFAKI